MRFSLNAIKICNMKFSDTVFCGFDSFEDSFVKKMTVGMVEKNYREFVQNNIIEEDDEGIHFSALGDHIFNMMLEPEQFIMIDNELNKISVRIYIRNTYYLCIKEDKTITEDDNYDRFTVELLPSIQLIVGSFAYAGNHNVDEILNGDSNVDMAKTNITTYAKAWDTDRNVMAELIMSGCRLENIVEYTISKIVGESTTTEDLKEDISGYINHVTEWMIGNLANEKIGEGE